MTPDGYDECLLPAALASSQADRVRHWRTWRRLHPSPERLSGIDYKLLPYLFPRLEKTESQDPMASVFRGVAKRVWAHNRLLLAQAADMQATLEAAGIPSILFKGAALLLGPCERTGDRSTADVDLLIAAPDIKQALNLLRPARPRAVRAGHAIALEGPGKVPVDLHVVPSQWSMTDTGQRRRDVESVRAMLLRRRSVAFAGGSAHIPDATDLALLNLTNTFAHNARVTANEGLWVLDLSTCADEPGFDDDLFLAGIRDSNAVALFRHHFAAFRPVMPDRLAGLADSVLALPISEGDRDILAALAAASVRAGNGSLQDPFRAQWYALRGTEEHRASPIERARYVAFCARDALHTIALDPAPGRATLKGMGRNARKTLEALKA